MSSVLHLPGKTSMAKLPYLPWTMRLPKSDEDVVLDDYVEEEDFASMYGLISGVVEEGQSYPRDYLDEVQFRGYYLQTRVFVLKTVTERDMVGVFYMKPNFPGRCSHICNAGFVVSPAHRGKGAMQVLTKVYLRIARDLGYQASLFNVVYVNNKSAVHVYRKMGFTQVGLIPKAGYLKDLGLTDAAEFHYDLTTLDTDGQPPGGWTE